MKKYKVNVNGTDYEIAVELIGEEEAKSAAPAVAQAPAAAPVAAPAAAPVAAPAANGEGEKVEAPMPGNIIDIKVAVGDSVKAGQVLVILEAMKMENEIMAGSDGTVTSIGVTKGSVVEAGTVLLTIK